MDTPSNEAIEAAIKFYYGDGPTGEKELLFWSDMLKTAYAIDFAAHQQAMQREVAIGVQLATQRDQLLMEVFKKDKAIQELQEHIKAVSSVVVTRDASVDS